MPGVALSLEEREEIRAGLERGDSCAAIARWLERSPTTVSREVARNGGTHRYGAVAADRRAQWCRRRPKVPKLLADRALARSVYIDLKAGYSPAGIAVRWKRSGGPTLCHEAIYQALYSKDFRGLRLLPRQCLRTRRRTRKIRGRAATISIRERTFGAMKLIECRPAGAADRTEPGHWEGDLIIGVGHRSAVVTLVERVSRVTRLCRVPGCHTAAVVTELVSASLLGVPSVMRASLTWDQGSEMAFWYEVEEDTGMPVYFCHPHSPWERPSNEHTNRQLRFWLPKGTDLSVHSQDELDRIS